MKQKISLGVLVLTILLSNLAFSQMPELAENTVNYTDRETGELVTGTDTGRWQAGEPNFVIVADGTDDTIICRFRSPDGNCYRLSVNDGDGHVPTGLIDRPTFDNAVAVFRSRANWGICERVENPWNEDWEPVGAIPTRPGKHTYTERQTGSVDDKADWPCDPEQWPKTETRLASIDNGHPLVSPPPAPPPVSPPSAGTKPSLACRINPASCDKKGGSEPAPLPRTPVCVDPIYLPHPSTMPYGQRYIATNSCGDKKPRTGREPTCVPTPRPDILTHAGRVTFLFVGSTHDMGNFRTPERIVSGHTQTVSGSGKTVGAMLSSARGAVNSLYPSGFWVQQGYTHSVTVTSQDPIPC